MKMKRIVVTGIIMTLIVMMIAGFTLTENKNSEVIKELEDSGFERISETVWSAIKVEISEETFIAATAWYDIERNYGCECGYTYDIDEAGNRVELCAAYRTFQWNYELSRFDFIDRYDYE